MTIVERDAVRAILLTPEREVLLLRIQPGQAREPFWIVPGVEGSREHMKPFAKFTPKMSDPVESKIIDCMRWWTTTELLATRERLTPLSLAEIVTKYIRSGPPPEPIDVEVLVD